MSELPRTPSFRLDGKRACVIGASRGIGFALAAALAEAGAELVIAARNCDTISAAALKLQTGGYKARSAQVDVANPATVRLFFDVEERFNIVVNAAGIAQHRSAIETPPESFDTVMDINCRGAFLVAREAAISMGEDGGSIIQISSQMGLTGGGERTVYCASKHAVEGMTKSMAIEWAHLGIRVNTICPTFVRTELTEPTLSDPEKVKWIERKIKLGRIARVEDLMGAVVFLASDASAMMTGTHLVIDGGWTAG